MSNGAKKRSRFTTDSVMVVTFSFCSLVLSCYVPVPVSQKKLPIICYPSYTHPYKPFIRKHRVRVSKPSNIWQEILIESIRLTTFCFFQERISKAAQSIALAYNFTISYIYHNLTKLLSSLANYHFEILLYYFLLSFELECIVISLKNPIQLLFLEAIVP